ncbi:hypothetical protein A9Q78_02695 [Methylophaga sp. 41_12_T18]|nr:hypothetical protein A9Q78_02695 [Methylophaga sp. 41_12_T18]
MKGANNMQSYRSLHPNHVHQLTVSVSKHYWITGEGILKYRHKKMEVALDKVESSKRNHLIHYIIRDHCSRVLYSEVASSKSNIDLQQFLFRAWSQKEGFAFCGIPELLTIPNTVQKAFPKIKEKVSQLGIKYLKVTSGFQAGVRDVKTLEEYMKFYAELPFTENHATLNETFNYVSTMQARTGKQSKLEMWQNNINTVSVPSESWLRIA